MPLNVISKVCERFHERNRSLLGGPNVEERPYIDIAGPLLFLSHTSETDPPVFVKGAEPPNPWINLQTMTVPMFGARASGSWKMKRTNHEQK